MRKPFFALAALVAAGAAYAAAKPETVIHYRQSVFHIIVWNFRPLSDMAKGATPYDAKEAALRAQRIAGASEQLLEGFAEGSDKGAETEAKPEIWQNRVDFESKLHDLTTQANALYTVAQGGDAAKFKAQFDKLKESCKSCHDKYKAE